MSDDEDGPPMLVPSENVGDAEASLNAEMADAQIKKVPISIITGQLSFHLLTSLLLLCGYFPDADVLFSSVQLLVP